jgi:hypothetical protein
VLFGVYVPTFGEYDVNTLAQLAREAEATGWDGFEDVPLAVELRGGDPVIS